MFFDKLVSFFNIENIVYNCKSEKWYAHINQRDYLQLSLVVAEHSGDINAIKSSLSTIDNEVAEVVDRLGNVVTKSELSGFMNIFGEAEFRNVYIVGRTAFRV